MEISFGKQLIVISIVIKVLLGIKDFNTASIFIDDEEVHNNDQMMVAPGSQLHVRCAARYKEKPYVISFYTNLMAIGTGNEYELQTNVSITRCDDHTRLSCGFRRPKNNPNTTTTFGIYSNCSAGIISLQYENVSSDIDTYSDVELIRRVWVPKRKLSDGKELFTENKQTYNHLACTTETYHRPTNLAIKSYNGSVIHQTWKYSPIVEISNEEMHCQYNGRVTCELEDILLKATYTKETYAWLSSCAPTLCHDELDWKNISTRLSSNAEVSFCFMMEGMGQKVTEQKIYKDNRLLNVNDKRKYLSVVTAIDSTLIVNTFKFTVVNIDNDDFGTYQINLLFGDGQSIGFDFSLYNSETVKENCLPSAQSLSFFITGVTLVVLTIVFALTFALYFTIKKFRLRTNSSKNSAQVVVYTNDDSFEGIKYIPLKEDQVEQHAA